MGMRCAPSLRDRRGSLTPRAGRRARRRGTGSSRGRRGEPGAGGASPALSETHDLPLPSAHTGRPPPRVHAPAAPLWKGTLLLGGTKTAPRSSSALFFESLVSGYCVKREQMRQELEEKSL